MSGVGIGCRVLSPCCSAIVIAWTAESAHLVVRPRISGLPVGILQLVADRSGRIAMSKVNNDRGSRFGAVLVLLKGVLRFSRNAEGKPRMGPRRGSVSRSAKVGPDRIGVGPS